MGDFTFTKHKNVYFIYYLCGKKSDDVLRIPQIQKFHKFKNSTNRPGTKPVGKKMCLDNIFGLLGTILLAQLINSVDFNLVTAAALLLLSTNVNGEVVGPKIRSVLVPKNPKDFLSDKQFKKEFRF